MTPISRNISRHHAEAQHLVMLLAASRLEQEIATMYPGRAKTTKMPSWTSVMWIRVAGGLAAASISGVAIVLP